MFLPIDVVDLGLVEPNGFSLQRVSAEQVQARLPKFGQADNEGLVLLNILRRRRMRRSGRCWLRRRWLWFIGRGLTTGKRLFDLPDTRGLLRQVRFRSCVLI